MVRLEDDLYHALFNAAHDNRTSMNRYIVQAVEEKVENSEARSPA